MKWLSFLLAGVLVFGVGCSASTEGAGGKKLTINPTNSVSLKAGEKGKKVAVSVKREKFDDTVTLTLSDLPDGVSADEKTLKAEKGEKEVTFLLNADAGAKIQEGHKAKVTASSGDLKVTETFTVDVKKD